MCEEFGVRGDHVAVQANAVELGAKVGVGEIEHARSALRHRSQRVDAVPVLEDRLQKAEPLEHGQANRLEADASAGDGLADGGGRLLEDAHARSASGQEERRRGPRGAEADHSDRERSGERPRHIGPINLVSPPKMGNFGSVTLSVTPSLWFQATQQLLPRPRA